MRLARSEADAFVESPGDVIVGTHLECDPATTVISSVVFDRFHQSLADAALLVVGVHDDVVDIEQRAGAEGGETEKADGQADGPFLGVSQKDAAAGLGPQLRYEILPHLGFQRVAIAHGLARVVVQQIENCLLVFGIAKLSPADLDIGHGFEAL